MFNKKGKKSIGPTFQRYVCTKVAQFELKTLFVFVNISGRLRFSKKSFAMKKMSAFRECKIEFVVVFLNKQFKL